MSNLRTPGVWLRLVLVGDSFLLVAGDQEQYTLTFTEHADYLYAHLSAETISEEIIRDYIGEIAAKSNETGKDRILLYRDIPVVLSTVNVFNTVNDSLEALRGKRLALVNPHAHLTTGLSFGMTVGQNRGGLYKLFPDVESALVWLLMS